MEFDKFFRVIHTGIDSYNLYALVVELFFAANDSLHIHEDLAANWIKKNNRSYRRLFLEEEGRRRKKLKSFDDKNFISFLKNHTNVSWETIRDNFKCETDKNRVVDCNTTNHEVFLESVMNQFKEIIKYPYEKKIVTTEQNIFLDNKSEKECLNETPPKMTMIEHAYYRWTGKRLGFRVLGNDKSKDRI